MLLAASITISVILALLIAYLWFKTSQQGNLVRELSASVGDVQKELAARRAQEAAEATEAAAEVLHGSKRKRARKK
jgi:hypothetical protein